MDILTILKANIRRKKGSFVSIIMLMTIISMALTAFLSIKENCRSSIENALEYADAPDITVYLLPNIMSDNLLESLESHEMVDRVVKVPVYTCDVSVNGEDDGNNWFIQRYDSKINRRLEDDLSGYSGVTEKPKKGEIYVPQGILTRCDCKIGDTVSIYPNSNHNETVDLKIGGVVVEPTNGCSIMGWKQVFVSDEDYEMLLDGAEEESCILKIYKNSECKLSDRQFRRRLNEDTSIIDNAIGSITMADSLHYTGLFPEIVISILLVFLVFLMMIVLIVMRHSISTSIEIDYVNLGVLKAMGFSKHKIRSVFVLQYMLAQLLGSVLGFVIAMPLVKLFGDIFQPIIAIPNENKIAILPCLLILAGVFLISALFVIFSTRKINRISPVRAIAGGNREVYFDSRIKVPIGKKMLISGIALRQFTSNMKRYIGTIVIATILVFFMLTVTALGDSVNSKSANEMMGFVYTECDLELKDPDEYDKRVEEIEGIIEKYSAIEKKYMVMNEYISINGENLQCMIYKNPEVMPIFKGRAPLYDNEIVITSFVAEELGIGIGDTVTVSRKDKKADFMITGFSQSTNDTGRCFMMNLDGIRRMGFENANVYWVGYSLKSTAHLEDIQKELNEKYGDILVCTAWYPGDNTMSTYNMAINAVKAVIYLLSVTFVLVVTVMVCKKSFQQEKVDIGIYKAVGFGLAGLRLQFAIRFLIAAVISVVIGSCLSMAFSEKIITLLLRSIGVSEFKIIFTPNIFVLPAFLICGCFFAFSYVVSRRIRNVDIKELFTE